MPSKKKTVSRKTPKVARMETPIEVQQEVVTSRKPIAKALWLIPAILIIVTLVLARNRGLVLAATVNGNPIWRWDVEKVMNSRYASSTLDELVNEKILKSEAAKRGIKVTDAEVNTKVSEIEKSLAGKSTLNEALAQQGMTMDDLRKQVELQLIIEKMTAASARVSDDEINTYITQNKELLTATDEAGFKQQAKDALMRQKQNDSFQKLFTDLKNNAKVSRFL